MLLRLPLLLPVTNEKNTVSDLAWRQSCTCPGAEALRRILDEVVALPFSVRDFAEMWAESRHEFKSRREAFKAAQASAVGRDREQLKDLYVAELRSRGRKIPGDAALDAAIATRPGHGLRAGRSSASANASARSVALAKTADHTLSVPSLLNRRPD